jgi:CDP-diacylglycerol--serine O-phosphatidyltransferase
VLIPMIFHFEFGAALARSPFVNGAVLAGAAALMVSRVPTFSFKRFRVPGHWVLPMLLIVGALAAFLTTEPWGTLLAIGALYIASIPLSIRSYHRLRRSAEELRVSTTEPAAGDESDAATAGDHPGH